jgi:hypothetical protein
VAPSERPRDAAIGARSGAIGAFILCPNVAAKEVLLRDGEPLSLSFFRKEPLSLRSFGEEDVLAFNQVMILMGGQSSYESSLLKPKDKLLTTRLTQPFNTCRNLSCEVFNNHSSDIYQTYMFHAAKKCEVEDICSI